MLDLVQSKWPTVGTLDYPTAMAKNKEKGVSQRKYRCVCFRTSSKALSTVQGHTVVLLSSTVKPLSKDIPDLFKRAVLACCVFFCAVHQPNCESLIAIAMGTWLTCSSLPFPSRPLFLPLSLSVCPSLWFHSAGEGSWVTVLSLANNSCGHYGEPYWWVFIYIELTQVFQTTWKFAPSGSTCPPDVQNRVFTSKGARYAARTSWANPKLGRSRSPTMFNIFLSNCCPH